MKGRQGKRRKYCEKCHALIENRAKYCPYCGNKIIQPQNIRKRGRAILMPILVCIFIICGVFLYEQVSRYNSQNDGIVDGISIPQALSLPPEYMVKYEKTEDGLVYQPNRVVLFMSKGAHSDDLNMALQQYAASVIQSNPVSGMYLIEFDEDKSYVELEKIVDTLEKNESFARVYLLERPDILTGDSFFNLFKPKSNSEDDRAIDDDNAIEDEENRAWKDLIHHKEALEVLLERGSKLKPHMAIIESLVDTTHFELNIYTPHFFVANKHHKMFADYQLSTITLDEIISTNVNEINHDLLRVANHGTHVAGIIGAKKGNGGMFGIVPDIPIEFRSRKELNTNTHVLCDDLMDGFRNIHNLIYQSYENNSKIGTDECLIINMSYGQDYSTFKNETIEKQVTIENELEIRKWVYEEYRKTNKESKNVRCEELCRTFEQKMPPDLKTLCDSQKTQSIIREELSNYMFVNDLFEEYRDWNYIIVKSAGNDNRDAKDDFYTRCLLANDSVGQHVIVVGALEDEEVLYNRYMKKASYSNYGEFVDVYAPGKDIYSSVYKSDKNEKYDKMSGTSMASPIVSGVCAMVYETNPELDYGEIIEIVKNNNEYSVIILTDDKSNVKRPVIDALCACNTANSKHEKSIAAQESKVSESAMDTSESKQEDNKYPNLTISVDGAWDILPGEIHYLSEFRAAYFRLDDLGLPAETLCDVIAYPSKGEWHYRAENGLPDGVITSCYMSIDDQPVYFNQFLDPEITIDEYGNKIDLSHKYDDCDHITVVIYDHNEQDKVYYEYCYEIKHGLTLHEIKMNRFENGLTNKYRY